jgi:response regulator RpfG family c-di-GMP phosphodiesterase
MTTLVQSTTPDTDLYDRAAGPSGARTAQVFLQYLLESSIIHPDDWDSLPKETREQIFALVNRDALVSQLADFDLLNSYQVARIKAGTFGSLVLGNYRVLGSLGSGGSSLVFEAEHLLMRRKVAVKVLPVSNNEDPTLVTRFLREMRAVGRLNHPNIVAAFDAGLFPASHPGQPDLYYFVMEHLVGNDLEKEASNRSLDIGEACALIYQIASALDEAHRHQLVHRDIKPSNVFVTQNRQAKLLDFGLVRHMGLGHAFPAPDVLLGSLEYLAPEQGSDSTQVDIRTDVFSLGSTLFYALTGASAFSQDGPRVESILRRQHQAARSARALRAEIPPELEMVVQHMIELRPANRMPTPQAVMQALLPFLDHRSRPEPICVTTGSGQSSQATEGSHIGQGPRVLIADPDPEVRSHLMRLLTVKGLRCAEAADAQSTMQVLRSEPPAAVLLAVQLPGMEGPAMLSALRDNPPCTNLKILMTSPVSSANEMASCLSAGADDYLPLTISDVQMAARVMSALKHKEVQDRTDHLGRQLLELNTELERSVDTRTTDLVQARSALVLALARLVEYRSTETIAHLSRMQRYSKVLAQEAGFLPAFTDEITPQWIQTLECCAPLHDIGNVGLPDDILLKAGRLDDEQLQIMRTHTTIGADTLQDVARRFGAGLEFLHMAIDIARHHHEHFDGTGYPDRLAGNDIPLAARIVALADAYDGLRSRRSQRPGLSHAVALQILRELSPGKFDPFLLGAFQRCATQFERIFREMPDSIQMDKVLARADS